MSDIFREVDEAMQKEKAAKLWKEYGPTLLLAAILVVLSTGIVTAYRGWDSAKNKEETSKLITAIEQKDMAPAMEKAAQDTRSGHREIALLAAAGKYADSKDFTNAKKLYDQVAADKSLGQDFRDLATILGIRAQGLDVRTQSAKEPESAYQGMIDRLLPIAKNDKATFQLQAKLDAALLYGDGMKDYTSALDMLKGFGNDSSTDSLKEKATALQHVYEYELSKTEKTSAPTPAPQPTQSAQ